MWVCMLFLMMVSDILLPRVGVGTRELKAELADEYQACHYEPAKGVNVTTSVSTTHLHPLPIFLQTQQYKSQDKMAQSK